MRVGELTSMNISDVDFACVSTDICNTAGRCRMPAGGNTGADGSCKARDDTAIYSEVSGTSCSVSCKIFQCGIKFRSYEEDGKCKIYRKIAGI